MVDVMRLVSSLSSGNYNRNNLSFSRNYFLGSLILFIIGFIIILFKLSFQCKIDYLLEKEENDIYQVLVPYSEISIWQSNRNFEYEKKQYSYSILKIGEEGIFQNNTVYLQLLIQVDKLSSTIPLVEISLQDENITLWDYLNKTFRGK